MDTAKLVQKLEDFFDLSSKKQRKKHDKLLKIIARLEEKQSLLEAELAVQSARDPESEVCGDLTQELQVIAELIDKARQRDRENQAEADAEDGVGDEP